MGKVAQRRIIGNRLLMLALLVLLCQATLPYFSLSCPVYQAGAAEMANRAGMPADCPMLHQAIPKDKNQPHGKTGTSCPLCEVMSPFHGFVAAGLIDLPPPPALVQEIFVASFIKIIRLRFAAAFSARAPPLAV